jgi:hypothetical protein
MRVARNRLLRLAGHMRATISPRSFGTAPKDAPVISSVADGVGTIVLNRPKALNALTLEMVQMLQDVYKDWTSNPQVRVWLHSGGAKIRC